MKRALALVYLAIMCAFFLHAGDTLVNGFRNPPPSAKARTWWHWLNGNVTKEGITADLEAMKRVGIQEAQLFNVSLGHPEGPAPYLSPEWLDLFHFAASEAKRIGLELGFHNCPGWSSSGGPWIGPENAMQEVVYSELVQEGGEAITVQLAQPETRLDYYRDIAVLAFPKPDGDERIDDLDYKKLSGRIRNHLEPDEKPIPASSLVSTTDIRDLTAKLSSGGILEWNAPPGEWIILRMGHTPTGAMNRFPSSGGQGLECDKMSRKAVETFWDGGIQPIIKKLDTLVGSVLTTTHIDSYEVGHANWTSDFMEEFQGLRGYDCSEFLPTLAGYYVESGEISERFLWDYRRTIGDLIAENYYAYFSELCHQHKLTLSVEPYWGPFDNMQVGASGDVVLCEFWSGGLAFFDSPKFVASIGKLNGSSIVGAEAFTDIGGWKHHPASLKSIGDKAWAQGINRFIFHTYVHQPWNVGPGLTLDVFGIDFNRLNTWWEQGKAYLDYIGRSQFLLQQGLSVADVLVFTGESSPNDALLIPEIKKMGYDYDLIGANKLALLTVKDGSICTPQGGEYRVLVLPETSWLTPGILEKLGELARAGASIIGPRPHKSPSLQDFPDCDKYVSQLADILWGTELIKENSVIEFLEGRPFPPDFEVEKGRGGGIDYIHREADETELYFVASSRKEYRQELCRFRVSGKQPEFWNPETGEISDAVVWQDNGDGTSSIPISLAPEGSVFVVFRKPPDSSGHIVYTSMELVGQKAAALPDLKIIKAEFGTLLPEGLVDVTEAVMESVHNDRLNILANRDLCSCDPAQGYIKELRVEYMIGDKFHEANAMEKEWLSLDADGRGELKIIKAVFGKFERGIHGIPSHNPVYDVREKVSSMVASNVMEIPADNSLADGIAVDGFKNELHIVYSTNGELCKRTVAEGQLLHLTRNNPEPTMVRLDGEVFWVSPYAGTLTYSTSSGKMFSVQLKTIPDPIELDGQWEVNFPSEPGSPEKYSFDKLTSWSTSSEKRIRYFSGTASYRNQFVLPEHLLEPGSSLELDLGSVRVIAEVILNGKNLGILWKEPYRINIDGFANKGENTLELKITNLWPNRLIGDEQFPEDFEREGRRIKEWPDWLINDRERPTERVTFAGYKHWDNESEPLPSGLMGPVIIRPYVHVQLLN